MTEQDTEKFHPTNGRVMGGVGLAAVLAFMVLGMRDGMSLWYFGLLACVAMLIWAAILRPGVRIAGDRLVLRNMFSSVAVPLAAIDQVVVSRVLAVRVGERRFVSPAINRPLRQTIRSTVAGHPLGGLPDAHDLNATAGSSYPDFVEHKIRTSATDHRARLGIKNRSEEQEALARDVHRDLAIPELAAMAASVLLLLVGIAIAL